MTNSKWSGLASFLLAVSFIVAPFIYLTGNLRDAMGALAYDLADLLSGPVWSASLVLVIFTLRERMGGHAPRRMSLAMWATVLAAGAMVAVACIRSANRQYHIAHPDLYLEMSTTVLVVWTTLVAGMSAAGWHFLGWAWMLVGSSGWTSRRIPRLLSALYLLVGALALFVYLQPVFEGGVVLLGTVASLWQGILLWTSEPEGTQTAELGHA